LPFALGAISAGGNAVLQTAFTGNRFVPGNRYIVVVRGTYMVAGVTSGFSLNQGFQITWRSALYPTSWVPMDAGGVPDSAGRYLPDCPDAGWARGGGRPAYGKDPATMTVDEGYGDGTTDATTAIQSAIDSVCARGGGTVQMPAGTFLIRLPQPDAKQILSIACSHLVLRGDGPQKTQMLVDAPRSLRGKAAIAVGGKGSIDDHAASPSLPSVPFAVDLPAPSKSIHLSQANAFKEGDWIVVRSDDTAAFRVEHRMDQARSGLPDLWPPSDYLGLVYPRRVV